MIFFSFSAFAQSAQEPFGKNRVQHQNFDWRVISTDNYEIYHYKESYEAAVLAAKYAEYDYEKLTDFIGFAPYNRVKIIVYASQSDLLQSNLGLASPSIFTGGQTAFQKSRVEVAYNGITSDFKREITRSVATLVITELLYSGNLKDMIQSSYFMTLPEWFIAGAAAYSADGWSMDMDDQIRDLFATDKISNPQRLTGDRATLIGHSLFNFIAERYGRTNVSNILNLTRVYRDEKMAISQALNISYHEFLQEWKKFYDEQTNLALDNFQLPSKDWRLGRTRKGIYYGKMRISPDGKMVAYIRNDRGRYVVKLRNLETGAKWTVYRGGYRQVDQELSLDLPVVAWQSNARLGIVTAKGDQLSLITTDVVKGKAIHQRVLSEIYNLSNLNLTGHLQRRKLDKTFKQIMDIDFSDDGNVAILSAEKGGQSDIYTYQLKSQRIVQVTNDFYDDLQPKFLPNSSSSFIFSSNRPEDTVRVVERGNYYSVYDPKDLYVYIPDSNKARFQRITQTRLHTEQAPIVAKDGALYYLSDENGIWGLCKRQLGKKSFQILTDFRQNMHSYDLHPASGTLIWTSYYKGKLRMYAQKGRDLNADLIIAKTPRQELMDERLGFELEIKKKSQEAPNVIAPKDNKVDAFAIPQRDSIQKDIIDYEFYVFEFEKEKAMTQKEDKNTYKAMTKRMDKINPEVFISKPLPYFPQFSFDNVVTGVRIDPLRGFGLSGEVNMSDLLGNHRVIGSVFGSTDFRTSIMWAEYQYLKQRVDFRVRYTKDVLYLNNESVNQRNSIHRLDIGMAYPFSPKARFSFTPSYYQRRHTNLTSPLYKDSLNPYLAFNFEFVFDNTRSTGLNQVVGTRFKLGLDYNFGIGDKRKNFNRYYVDFRKYLNIHRGFVWANRVSAGGFFGTDPKSYMIGGMDNWWGSQTDPKGPLEFTARDDTKDYSYLLFNQYVTNLRGVNYNYFYGSNYFLFNSELRLPIVTYLYKGSITSEFFRNLQLTSFYDIGTAWTGISPFDPNNSYNTKTIPEKPVAQTPVVVTVTNYKNPFLVGYGFGARSMLLGYYLKLDFAWAEIDYIRQPLKVYVTLGYDF